MSGKNLFEQYSKPKIIQHLNIADNSTYTDSAVDIDEPIFQLSQECNFQMIQFTNYEPLQIKEQILKLRNKDKYIRSVKIIPPDSKLFQVIPCKKNQKLNVAEGTQTSASATMKRPKDVDNMSCSVRFSQQLNQVAPGMEVQFIVRFSPEAKIDYSYDLIIVTEREKFIMPIRAIGCKAMIDFPDQLDFGLVPVKHPSEKPIMIRNVGEKTTKWHLKVPKSFNVNKTEGILEVDKQEQLLFQFIPQESKKYHEDIYLCYDNLEACIPVRGESHNDNVYLSKAHLHMEDTYITLYSHHYFQIVNKSSVPVEFSWRAFATEKEENEKKTRLNMQLSQEEAEERMILEESNLEESMAESLDSDDSYDEDELNKKQERAQSKAIATLARKYQSIRKAVDEDLMLFQDEIFNIEPLQGKIWPNTEITCCVTFKPQGPLHYSCTAFCNITCSEERLPLNLTGQGIGPKAALSINEWDMGDIFVNQDHAYNFTIENKGEIDCYYKLIPYETPFGSKFQFKVTEGRLGVNESSKQQLQVKFCSDILGEFSETFRFALEGSAEMLPLTFKGHVVAPTFKFSEDIIEFGKVSYKFPETKVAYLTNTSDVDINYVIRVPGDGRTLQTEFNITNEKGKLKGGESAKIIIEFIPSFKQTYDMVLVVDLEGVGQDMLAVPIKAECQVPEVKIEPNDFLEYGNVFLRYPRKKPIYIENLDNLRAKFEILPQDEQSKRIAIIKADKESGVIEEKEKLELQITLKTEILHPIRIPFYVKIEGHQIPHMITVVANSIGPIVEVDKTDLDYGNVEVLKDYTEKLVITNNSKIPAEYTAFTKNKVSIWKVIQRHGTLQPDEAREIEVVCNADECQRFSDTLHIIINNGMDLEVYLKAKGTGSTLFCKDNLNNGVDFGTEYTHNNITKEFFLENRGRKQQKIQWQRQQKPGDRNTKKKNDKSEDKSKTGIDNSKKDISMISGDGKEEELKFVFAVVPDQVVLQPKMGIFVQFRANSFNVGEHTETFICQSAVGGERKPKVVFNTVLRGNFITPTLSFTEAKLFFKYLWEKNVPSMPIQKNLEIQNSGDLQTTVTLKISPPFSCNAEVFTLAPQKTETVKIDFDPGMKQDRFSGESLSKLQITHKGHPHKDFVELIGEVCFPNLKINPSNIEFGCILNDTSKKRYLTMTNISEMDVAYDWSFLEEEIASLNQIEDENAPKKKKKKDKKAPINEVFDILPVSGILQPGETEQVEFTFYAGHGIAYNGIAVCSVDGGPDYEIPLQGESSFVSHKLSTNELDFQEVPYNEHSQKEFFIENIGKVPFEFNVNLNTVSRPGIIECHPMVGKVMANEKFKVIVKFFPGVPDNIDEMFLVEVAHFPAERFKVKAVGIYPGCLLSFPRSEEDDFSKRFEDTKRIFNKGKVNYMAAFSSSDVKQVLGDTKKTGGKTQKDIGLIPTEPFQMDIEAEADRKNLCDKILTQIDMFQAKQALRTTGMKDSTGNQSQEKTVKGVGKGKGKGKGAMQKSTGFNDTVIGERSLSACIEGVNVGTYVCDFGHMIINTSKKKTFRVTNVGKLPISFNFDKKALGVMGINIEPDKGNKIPPNTSQQFTVVFQARKNAKHGKVKYVVPVDVKQGPSYNIEFVANFTMPELTLSSEQLDFSKVCVGTRKTIKFRLENNKEVPCDWFYYYKQDVAGVAAKEGERFTVSPTSGYLLPGQKQTIDIMFTPVQDKSASQKLIFKCKENSKQFPLNCKGNGIYYTVDLLADLQAQVGNDQQQKKKSDSHNFIKLGPVLPYDESAEKIVELKNPMDQAIEVYSLEFDKTYIEEEEILRRCDMFIIPPPIQTPGQKEQILPPEPLYLPLRKAGDDFWANLKQADETKRKLENLKKQSKDLDNKIIQHEEAKKKHETAIEALEEGAEQPEAPEELLNEEQLEEISNEKTELDGQIKEIEAESAMEKKDPPKKVKKNDRLNIIIIGPEQSGKSSLAQFLCQEHDRGLVKLDNLLEWCKQNNVPAADEAVKYLEERDEVYKKEVEELEKAQKGKKRLDEKIERSDYTELPKEMLLQLLQARVQSEDCNAGVIFDNLTQSENIKSDAKFVFELISEALEDENIQLIMLQPQKDEHGQEISINYRYEQRKIKEQEDKEKAEQEAAQKAKEATMKKTKKDRGPKRGGQAEEKKPDTAPVVEEKKEEEKEEQLFLLNELEGENKENYLKFYEEMIEVFTAVNVKQMQGGQQEENQDKDKEGEDEAEKPAEAEKTEEEDKKEGDEENQEEDVKETEIVEPKFYGARILSETSMQQDIKYLCKQIRQLVPEPIWPDPDKEPLPPPIIHSIVKKPTARGEMAPVTLFKILTPFPIEQEGEEQQPPAEGEEEAQSEPKYELKEGITRWILQPKESKKLHIKFFSTKSGLFDQALHFEVVGQTRPFTLNVNAVCEFPQINPNPKNVFMVQKKTRPAKTPDSYLQKCYIQSEQLFDFGPLLIGKNQENREDETMRKVNSTTFRITNNGRYDCHVDFCLKSTMMNMDGSTATEKTPFIFEQESLDLKQDQTENLTVWAIPEENKLYKDEIVALIKDNPTPVIFNVACLGCKPEVEVDQETVEFERLLLNQTSTKTLQIKNVSAIPVKWNLAGVEELPEEFEVDKTSGTLKPCQDVQVEIKFSAKKQEKFTQKLTLEVEDTEGFEQKQQPKSIEINAEAFNINVDIKYPQGEAAQEENVQVIDFDAVRVGDPKEKQLTLKNIGLFSIKYSFAMKKKATRDMFTIEPMEGLLEPNEEKQVTIRFQSQREIRLKTSKNTSDIKLNILEGSSDFQHEVVPINVNVNSVFSKYAITPLKNINFGPMQFDEKKSRSIDIKNDGLFEFKFNICDYKDQESKAAIKEERERDTEERKKQALGLGEPEDPKKKAAPADPKKGGAAPAEGGPLTVSQFTVSPSSGSIPPGSTKTITVEFAASGDQFYQSTLAIDVANRDPNDQPDGIGFDLAAESCRPGINTNDMDSIFEEQTVIPSLDPQVNTQTVITSSLFANLENVFWFGTLIASKVPEGAVEKFKISNPNKIPCTVNFSVKPRTQSKSEGFAFEISPESVRIPPHEHAYVKVSFKPTNMMTYGGIFEALVENGDPNAKNGKLTFELKGEGTLPTLLLEKPNELTDDGTPQLKFKKTRIGKTQILPVTLKNEGAVPATVRFDQIKHEAFHFLSPLTASILPKQYQQFDVSFEPKEAGNTEPFTLSFNTLHNPYENHKVVISGEGYTEVVTFEDLPGSNEEELQFGDCYLNKTKIVYFNMVNNGDSSLKFSWNNGGKDEFKFSPSEGHLHSKQTKKIKVSFKTDQTIKHENLEMLCETHQIQFSDQNKEDWDNSMMNIRMVRPSEHKKILAEREAEERRKKEEAELAAMPKGGKKPPAQPAKDPVEEIEIDESEDATVELEEVVPEPQGEKVEGSEKSQTLKASATADLVKYECDVDEVFFKPTLMYATRSYKFKVKNTSLINLDFNFKIVNSQTGVLDAGPFSIIPRKGSIQPDCDEHFIVKFSPLEVSPMFERLMSANIQHLHPEQEKLILELSGSVQRPVCHFELPASQYREKKAKDMTPIDSKYNIIEFESLGTKIKNTKRFMVVNPTSQGYEFEWDIAEPPIENEKQKKPMFRCLTQKGVILSGKKFEMVFEYTPDDVGEHESYWVFKISQEKIVQHFMVVGHVVEPIVLLETGKINFGPLLLDGKNREVVNLINQEHIPFNFNFSKESIKGNPDYGDSLVVSPMSGTVGPQSQIPIEVIFRPKFEMGYNYNIVCNVKRKARPLVLNVKGTGYTIHHQVLADKGAVVKSGDPYNFDFGDFFINEKKTKQVQIVNSGEFNFDFQWKRSVNKYITISPENGTVKKGEKQDFEIVYLPVAEHKMKNYKAQLAIVSGPKYDFILSGQARKPGVKLSFTQYDFGPSFVLSQPMPKKITLELVNNDNTAISVETLFEKKPYLDVQLSPGQVILPSTKDKVEKLEIPIIFTPREIMKYKEVITLDFNGLYTFDVTISGEGIPMSLELNDPDKHTVDFGVVSVGGDITKTVELVNKSKKAVVFTLIQENPEEFKKNNLQIHPDKEISLKPKEVLPVEVRFTPKARMPNFWHSILLQIKNNEARKIFTVQGVSHGIELKLMDEFIGFGPVVKGSRLNRQLQLANFGDMGAKFKWDQKAYSKNFTINPSEGYIPAHEDIYLDVTFHPEKVDSNIQCKNVKCEITGGESLNLNLLGQCIDMPVESIENLNFESQVRQTAVQSVEIKNPTTGSWKINPTISNVDEQTKDYFKGERVLEIPAGQSSKYEVIYAPLTMTKEKRSDPKDPESEMVTVHHEATLFFPLPSGEAKLIKMFGKATEPNNENTLTYDGVAKKSQFFSIPIENWLKTAQRFKVSWEMPEGVQVDETTFIRGANTFDVAGNSKKEYKLNFLAYKSGVTKITITFKNETSGEYMFYEVQVNTSEPELQGEIELIAPVRDNVKKQITLENPTKNQVEIERSQFSVGNDYVEITPENFIIPPQSEKAFEIGYRPLSIGEEDQELLLKHPVLGDYKYSLKLKGIVSTTQRSMHFKTAIGSEIMQAYRFTHYLKKPTTYQAKCERIDGNTAIPCDFKLEAPTVPATAAENASGTEIKVNIKYEPTNIGESRGILKLTSPENIEYTCLLYGHTTAPQPQGPFKIPVGKPMPIEFKNPLNEKIEFTVSIDNPCFQLAAKLAGPVDPGKVVQLQVKYDANANHPNTGRMIIQTKGVPPWVFYLHGE